VEQRPKAKDLGPLQICHHLELQPKNTCSIRFLENKSKIFFEKHLKVVFLQVIRKTKSGRTAFWK